MNRLRIFIILLISLTAISQVFAQPLFNNVVLYGNVFLSNGTPANGASYNIVVYDDNDYTVLSNVSGIVGEFVSNMIYESQNLPNSAGDIFNVTVVFLDETGKWSHVITAEEREMTIVIMPDMTTSPSPPPAVTTTVVQRMDYKFNITWAPVTDNESGLMEYRIYQRQNDNSSTDTLIDTVPTNYTQPYIAGPGNDTGDFYQYMVTAVDTSSNEGNGTYVPDTPVPPIPFAPLGTLAVLGSGLATYAYYRRRVN